MSLRPFLAFLLLVGLWFGAPVRAQAAGGMGGLPGRGVDSFLSNIITGDEVRAAMGAAKRLGPALGVGLRRSLPLAGKIVGWGGVLTMGPEVIKAGLDWFYGQVANQSSGNNGLDDWYKGTLPPNTAKFGFVGGPHTSQDGHPIDYQSVQFVCNSTAWGGSIFTATAVDSAYNPARYTANHYLMQGNPGPDVTLMAMSRAPTSDECTGGIYQSPTFDSLPANVAQTAADIANQYVRAHPEQLPPAFSYAPTATPNQVADALVDPSIDSDGDGYTDGQEVAAGSNPADPKSIPQAKPGTTYTNNPDGSVTRTDTAVVNGQPVRTSYTYTPGTVSGTKTNPDGSLTKTDATTNQDGTSTTTETTTSVATVTNPDGSQTETTTTRTTVTTRDPAGKVTDTKTSTSTTKREIPAGQKCAAGETTNADGSCTPKPADPGNTCGDLSFARLIAHFGSVLHDLVFPCKELDWAAFKDLLAGKFPFSIALAIGGFVDSGGGGGANPLPTSFGPFTLDFGFANPLFAFMKIAFRTVLWVLFFRWLLDRVAGQVTLS